MVVQSLMPRIILAALVSLVLASASIAFAATQTPAPAPAAKPAAPAPAKPTQIRVPDVKGEAYVFAKGILEDAGFAWSVTGAQGFAVNVVSGQSPSAGTVVVDTGAPTIVLNLRRNVDYAELGTPENAAPYSGTEVVLAAQPETPEKVQEESGTSAPETQPAHRLRRPAFAAPAPEVIGATGVELVSSSEFAGDVASWVRGNGLDLREYKVPGDARKLPLAKLPAFVAPTYRGHRLVKAIRQQATTLLVYGRNFASGRFLVALDKTGQTRYAFDFVAYGNTPVGTALYQRVVWAAEADGVLYVETAHAGYAKDSGLRNGYVTAIDPKAKKVLWRSPALVANALRFELYGNLIVTGYGFTDESDYLFLLDRKTGKVVGRADLPTAADYIVAKSGVFYVRTYDRDVVAKLSSAS